LLCISQIHCPEKEDEDRKTEEGLREEGNAVHSSMLAAVYPKWKKKKRPK
jgi:hypothetical protein